MKFSSDKTRVFFNTGIVTAATVADKLVFFFINIIVARYLNIEQYGEYTTAIGYATLFSSLSNIGITQTLIRAVNLEADSDSENFGNALFLKTVIAIITYSVMAASLYFTNYNRNTVLLTMIFGLVRVGNEYMVTFYALYEAREKFLRTSVFNFSFSLSFLTGTFLVVAYKGDYFDFANLRLVIVVVFILVLAGITMKNLKVSFEFSSLKAFLVNALPFGISTFMSTLLSRINIIILSLMHGTIYSGIFNNGYVFFATLIFIPGNFYKVLTPFLYKALSNNDSRKFQFAYDVFSKVYAIISFYLMVILFLYAEEIIKAVFTEKYIGSVAILKIVSLAIPPIFNMPSIIITAIDRQKYNTLFTFIGVIINVAGNFILIYFFKAEGAAISLVITYWVIFVLCTLYLFKSKFISVKYGSLVYILTIIISVVSILIKIYLFVEIQWLYSILITTFVYLLLVFLVIMKKDDIRIIKETLGLKK